MQVAALALGLSLTACGGDGPAAEDKGVQVTSTAFDDGGHIPERYSCLGQNLSPPLQWAHVPFTTNEQAVVVHDPDAPSGTFYHWVLAGIPGGTRSLAEGEVLEGAVQGLASSGKAGYIGMCHEGPSRPLRTPLSGGFATGLVDLGVAHYDTACIGGMTTS